MSKLYIDGKLIGIADCCGQDSAEATIEIGGVELPATAITVPCLTITAEVDWSAVTHISGECHSLPTYFCPYCAREALRGVDVSDPSGWRMP